MSGASLALGGTGTVAGAHRFAHAAMATVFEVHCAHPDARYARQAAEAAFDLVDRLEREQSRFVANSDVSRVNALAAGESARVTPSTMECLEIAFRLHVLTDRAFDVSIGTGLDRLELVPDAFAVHARDGGARLDLGGIGKGYAVDRMAEVLDEWDIRRALVHGGFSSVLARDAPPERDGWPLTLSAPGPADGAILARISARQLAFSASGTRKGGHILDPRSGHPVREGAAWVALACRGEGDADAGLPDAARSPAAVAEGLSTAFMILSLEEIEERCRRWPGLEAWLFRGPAGEGAPAALVHLGTPRA
ncbi:MAG TPA: FAD:protein FMN transferase [Vicinamibacteria bacterium]|nr:FAD:protein FMN transferase [Vicinamibacteria bacterium]